MTNINVNPNVSAELEEYELQEIAENCANIYALNEEEEEILTAALAANIPVVEAVDAIQNGEYRFYKNIHTYGELGEEVLFEALNRKLDSFSDERDPFLEHIAPFIDYDRYGRAYCINNDCYFTKYGVLELF